MRRWIARLAIAAVIVGVSLRWVRELQAGHQQDFLVYVNAARDWLAGRSLYVDRPALPYTYPPVAALLFLPFAPLPDGLVMAVWVVLNLGLGAWLTRRLFPGQPWWLLALVMLSAPIGRSIYLGQINLVQPRGAARLTRRLDPPLALAADLRRGPASPRASERCGGLGRGPVHRAPARRRGRRRAPPAGRGGAAVDLHVRGDRRSRLSRGDPAGSAHSPG